MLYTRKSKKTGGVTVNCMKCGRDMESGEVFCDACREEMAKYPVKPGTVVQLPYRREDASSKKTNGRRKQPTQEKQVASLRKTIRTLIILLAVQFLLMVCLAIPVAKKLLEEKAVVTGQNYSSVSDTEPNAAYEIEE